MPERSHASDRPPPGGRLAYTYLGVVSVTVLAVQGLPTSTLVRDLVYSLVGLSVVVAILVGVNRYQPPHRAAWYLMAGAQTSWVVADTSFNWQVDVLHVTTFPTVSDLFYLLGYPAFTLSLVMLVRDRSRSRRDLAPVLDSAIVTAGLSLLAWVLLARPTFEIVDHSIAAATVSGTYLAMDIVLIGGLVQLLSSPGGRSPTFRLLLTALGLLIGADTLSIALDLFATNTVSAVDYLWQLSYAAWGAAALHPSMTKLSDGVKAAAPHFRGPRLVAIVIATLIAPGVLAVQEIAGTPIDLWPVVIGATVMSVLVVGRMSLAIQQIASVHQSLEGLQEELAIQATHDPMTGMANRTQLMRLLAGSLGRTRRRGGAVGLLFLDLDGFKEVNDTHGHRAGDEVLRQVGIRMQREIRGGDFAGRLGGDEFLVGIEQVTCEEDAVGLAQRLISSISEPIRVSDDLTVRVGASVGVAISRGGETDVEALLHEADLAVYAAKAAGRGRVELFSGQERAARQVRMDVERELTVAIAADELVLHYQPIVCLQTGQVECYEALVRWARPGGPLLDPADFLPIAESTDLIHDVDRWVLRAAVAQLSLWNQQRGDRTLQVAVNISGRHISHPRIRQDVAGVLEPGLIDPGQLVIEITETALMDRTSATANLVALRELGVVISLDDFGTGYHSSAQLSLLPIDKLKIDRQFVVASSDSERSLLELMVKTAHAFELEVVAEGVETEEQLALVRALGCEYVQGYYYGRPAPARDLRTRTIDRSLVG